MEKTRIIVITAVAVLCVSVIMSAYFTRSHQQKIKKSAEEASRNVRSGKHAPNPQLQTPPQRKKSQESSASKKNGWAFVMLPFYSLGIFGYIIYVVGKIMQIKYSTARKNRDIKLSWNKVGKSKGRTHTKITMYEIQQLERKLQETEKAVQQIFDQTCRAVTAAAKACESCSSDEEYTTRSIKRFQATQSTDAGSSQEQPRLSSENKLINAGDSVLDSCAFPRRRKTKDTKRGIEREGSDLHSCTSPSDGETENTLRFVHKDESPKRCTAMSSSEEDDRVEEKPVPETGDREELLRTAKDIRKTMSQLQSYVDDKKVELFARQ